MSKKFFLSWEFVVLKILVLAALLLLVSQPTGSIAGRISLEQPGFGIHTYKIRDNKVYALAVGPRKGKPEERGVWINQDGSFQINQLPIGEYTLKVHASGYATRYMHGLFVKTDSVTRLPKSIRMELLPPSVNIASNTRVYTSQEKPYFWLNTSGAVKAEVRIYRKDLLAALRDSWQKKSGFEIGSGLSVYKNTSRPNTFFKDNRPLLSLTRKIDSAGESWARENFKLDNPLEPGDYFVEAKVFNAAGESQWNLAYFTVTDLGLLVKQGPEKTLVRAIDLNSLRPRANVFIDILSRRPRSIKTLAQGKTDSNGFLVMDRAGDGSSNILVHGREGDDNAWGGLWYYRRSHDQYRTYFYTDRPVYRLGQTARFKVMCRDLTPRGFKTPDPQTVRVTFEDPDSQKISETSIKTNSHGTFHGSLAIPEDGKTGGYQVRIEYANGARSWQTIEVAQYRKPQYKVTVSPDLPRVVAGQTASAKIQATYYFGGPVANAKVKYTIYACPDWSLKYRLNPRPQYYDFFEDEDYSYGGYWISEGEAWTDKNGQAQIKFKTQPIKHPDEGPLGDQFVARRYKIEAEVTDLSRMSVISSNSMLVTPGNLALFVDPENYVVKAGEPISSRIRVVDFEGKPAANQQVSIELSRWLWDSARSTYKGQKIEGLILAKTDEKGYASATFKTVTSLPTDTYYITAWTDDSSRHRIYDQNSVWIASSSSPYIVSKRDSEKEPLSIVLDKSVYKPGETARAMITAPVTGKEGRQALVCLEGSRLYEYRILELKSTANLVEIPIRDEYAPNIYLSASMVGPKRQFYSETKKVRVSPDNHFIDITVDTDRKKYSPGDTVNYTIKARRANGQPAPETELSLGVVDESIYAIRAETAQNIKKFFYRQRSNDVTSITSFPEQYSGGPDKTQPRIRKNFKDTAAWLPDLLTDSKGTALASVKLPDNLTTWKATVRGITRQTDVGSQTQKVLSTKDFMVRLALPRFFTEGDRSFVTAVIHNRTDRKQKTTLKLELNGQLATNTDLHQVISVDKNSAERFSWPVKAVNAGNAKIQLTATCSTAGDAVARSIPVRPLGVKTFAHNAGMLFKEDDKASIPVGLSSDAEARTASYKLSLAGSSIGPVVGNYNTLIKYPYGCTEQTINRLMPSVVAVKLSKELGLKLSDSDREKFEKVHRKAMAKLISYQNYDGGWGWWQSDQSNRYITTLVLNGLHLLKDTGYPIKGIDTRDACKWLSKEFRTLTAQLKDPERDMHEYEEFRASNDMGAMLNTLTLYGYSIPSDSRDLMLKRIKKTPPEGLARMVVSFKRAGDMPSASKCYNRLMELANKDGSFVNWDHSQALLKKLMPAESPWPYTYRFTGVETTALAMQAVLEMDRNNTEIIERIKNWILLQRGKDGWGNTKTTAQVFMALLKEETTFKEGKSTNFETLVTLDGGEEPLTEQFAFNRGNIYGPESVTDLNLFDSHDFNKPVKPQKIEIAKRGTGRLYYDSMLTYFRKLQANDVIAAKAMPKGIKMTREFFRLEPKVDKKTGHVSFLMRQPVNKTVRAGDTVLMRLKIEAPVSLPYVILDASLPSGAEVVETDSPPDLIDAKGKHSSVNGNYGWWWTHRDILDDRLVFFISDLKAGKIEFNTLVRLEMPGSYQIIPVSIEGMYTDRIRAYSGLGGLEVKE